MNRILSLSVWAALLLGLTACNKPADSAASSTADSATGAAAGGGKKRKIAFVSNGVAAFWTIASAGVKTAGEKLGVDAQTLMPVEGISDQKRMIEDLLTKGVDGIAVSPIDPANQTDLLNTAARRAKLLTHDSDAPNSDRLVYIGMDNYKAGRMCGDLVREAMPKGGTVMIFIGRLEQDNSKRRRQGTIDAILGRPENPANYDAPGTVLEGNGFKILGTLTDQFDRPGLHGGPLRLQPSPAPRGSVPGREAQPGEGRRLR
jgi:ribose transport system substrate-binding protein